MPATQRLESFKLNSSPYIDELIRERRAKRGFLDRPVPLDMVKEILSVAKFAPSSRSFCHASISRM